LIKNRVARTKKVELAENRLGCESLGVGETVVVVVVYCSTYRSCEAVKNKEHLANGEPQYWCRNPHYGRDDISHVLLRQRYEREPCNHNETNKEI
jgi:hypothetical protein